MSGANDVILRVQPFGTRLKRGCKSDGLQPLLYQVDYLNATSIF